MSTIQSKSFFQGKHAPIYEAGEGITRQFVGYNNDIMMVKMTFKKGSIGYQHSHPHSQASYIVSGKFEVTIDGDTSILEAGDGFFAKPDVMHGLVCLESGELLDVFTPIREDFYKNIPESDK